MEQELLDFEVSGDEEGGEAREMARRLAEARWRGKRDLGLSADKRSELARKAARARTTFGGGRPRKIMHNPGARGGCRCANCRKQSAPV